MEDMNNYYTGEQNNKNDQPPIQPPKKNNGGKILLVIILLIIFAAGGYYAGSKNLLNLEKEEDVKKEPIEDPTPIEEENKELSYINIKINQGCVLGCDSSGTIEYSQIEPKIINLNNETYTFKIDFAGNIYVNENKITIDKQFSLLGTISIIEAEKNDTTKDYYIFVQSEKKYYIFDLNGTMVNKFEIPENELSYSILEYKVNGEAYLLYINTCAVLTGETHQFTNEELMQYNKYYFKINKQETENNIESIVTDQNVIYSTLQC